MTQIAIEKATVVLGEKEYEIAEASYLRAKPWKQRFLAEVKPLFEQFSGATDMEFNSPADLLKVMPLAETILVDAIEKVFELLIAYSPVLEDDREYIEAHATERQILAAFQEVAAFVDPFGMVSEMRKKIGRNQIGISSNLQSANGA